MNAPTEEQLRRALGVLGDAALPARPFEDITGPAPAVTVAHKSRPRLVAVAVAGLVAIGLLGGGLWWSSNRSQPSQGVTASGGSDAGPTTVTSPADPSAVGVAVPGLTDPTDSTPSEPAQAFADTVREALGDLGGWSLELQEAHTRTTNTGEPVQFVHFRDNQRRLFILAGDPDLLDATPGLIDQLTPGPPSPRGTAWIWPDSTTRRSVALVTTERTLIVASEPIEATATALPADELVALAHEVTDALDQTTAPFTTQPGVPIAPNPAERVDSNSFELSTDWDQLQLEVHWTEPDPQHSPCGSILAFDNNTGRWVERWSFRTDKADRQQTSAPEDLADCEDANAAGPGPDLVSLTEDMRAEPNLLLCWFPHTDHGCETLLPHELVMADPVLKWADGGLFVQLTGIEVHGYQTHPLPPITEDELFNPPFDLLVLYLNNRPEGGSNLSASPQGVHGIRIGNHPAGRDLTFRLDFETPEGHLIATSGDFTLQVPPQ